MSIIKVAKNIYRNARVKIQLPWQSNNIDNIFRDANTSNPEYSNFIALSRYAKWLPDKQRRETWKETVNRYVNFWRDKGLIDDHVARYLFDNIYRLRVMPSMRCLMTAGKALDEHNVSGYSCAFAAVDDMRVFGEFLYILMCGTGIGFSNERQFINLTTKLPKRYFKTNKKILVEDSKLGWATAINTHIQDLCEGKINDIDTRLIRPAGTLLKTFGGRASGPGPLIDLWDYIFNVFKYAKGNRLNSLAVYNIVCKTGDITVAGGVRRSALINLSNLTDARMAKAKAGEWWIDHPEYSLSNNSVAYQEKPEAYRFLQEWQLLMESKCGERGIFNREGANKHVAKFGRRKPYDSFGINPCGEIILRSKQFCNLSEVVARKDDDMDTLKDKVNVATILGTLQATLTNFKMLSEDWKLNTEEEALLGVSITGIMDCKLLNNIKDDRLANNLESLRQTAVQTNKEWAEKLNINQAAAITCVKPSGTVSQLVDSASGIHPRFSEYYIRTVRADKKDPLAHLMKAYDFPVEDAIDKESELYVFSFPMRSDPSAVFTEDRTAIEQLETCLIYKNHWCEHNTSITVFVKEDEWIEVAAWVYKHFDDVIGITFLPVSDHIYKQAPYQKVTKAEYEALLNKMPKNVNWSLLSLWERYDTTTGTKTLSCNGNVCELVDIEGKDYNVVQVKLLDKIKDKFSRIFGYGV
jgi:ribonucleoside-triphosphate reductase (thioredoxin)